MTRDGGLTPFSISMSQKKALITGITGQDGAYLSKLLLEKGYEVHGTSHDMDPAKLWRLRELGVQDRLRLHEWNILEDTSIRALLQMIAPDEIYHLAARSFVASSWREPLQTAEVNAIGTLRVLEAMREHCPGAKFYQASTSEMYGHGHQDLPQDENAPLHPRSPYAVSKLFAHWMTINYRESYGLFACCGILFNHESPLRGLEFVTRKISDGVARIKLGLSDSLTLGNLDAKRDWGFAGDYVEVMWLMLQRDTPEEFVISTGETHSVRDFLECAFAEAGIGNGEKYIRIDERYLRPIELEELSGRNDKARAILGWKPSVSFRQLVSMMVRRDLERLSASR